MGTLQDTRHFSFPFLLAFLNALHASIPIQPFGRVFDNSKRPWGYCKCAGEEGCEMLVHSNAGAC